MNKYVGDNQVTLTLSGLRFVQKEDNRYSSMPETYFLRWEYKGSKGSTRYEKKEDRDAIYDKIQEALIPN